MVVSKCILPLRHEGTLNSHRAACLLVRLVEGKERWVTSDPLQGALPENWVKPSHMALSPAGCSTLRLTTGVQLASCHEGFRGP
ncbi:hypothetical protein TNCV_526601 [Trichonephila clavipes]|nr:hypothetical protein TNCV_526601 [Trichonephila clavipes]